MAGPISFCDEFRPDFGLPWPRRYEDPASYAGWTDAEIIEDALNKKRIEEAAVLDSMQFGWTLENWKEVCENWGSYDTHCIFGGNRSSKSVFCARLFVWLLMMIPEAKIRCYHVNKEKSIAEQQAYIWDALPDRFKHLSRRRGSIHNVQYTQKDGFVSGKLILPPLPGCRRGSEMIFGTYSQYEDDPQCVEGWWAHAIWGDEEMPLKMFERLLTRLYDARGRLVLSFTTIQGWSPLVADVIGRAKTLRRRPASLLMNRQLQVAQESTSRKSTRIYYFWTQDNPFIPPETIEKLRGRPQEEILSVAYGIPTKPALSKFPKFDETVHVIEHDKLPWLQKPAADAKVDPRDLYTFYHVIDPSGAKPWAMLWFAVGVDEKVYVYREWPGIEYGAWGEQGDRPEGKAGPAQKPNGWGIRDYVELIRTDETGEEIFERLIDPRLGAALTQAKEGATSIISELEDEGLTYLPAPGLHVDHGLQLINSMFAYDTSKDVSVMNSPKLFISDRCVQTIECIKNYTGVGADKEVWKDFVDCIRYLLESGAMYVSKVELKNHGKTFSY